MKEKDKVRVAFAYNAPSLDAPDVMLPNIATEVCARGFDVEASSVTFSIVETIAPINTNNSGSEGSEVEEFSKIEDTNDKNGEGDGSLHEENGYWFRVTKDFYVKIMSL